MNHRPKCPRCGGFITRAKAVTFTVRGKVTVIEPEFVRCENCGWRKERDIDPVVTLSAALPYQHQFSYCHCGSRYHVGNRYGGLCGRCFNLQSAWERGARTSPAPYLGSIEDGWSVNPDRKPYIDNLRKREELARQIAELRSASSAA